jgi:hypothetical protein
LAWGTGVAVGGGTLVGWGGALVAVGGGGDVGGSGVADAGTAVGGTSVAVGGSGVTVGGSVGGGSGVLVGGCGVSVGTGLGVGGNVFVGKGVAVKVGLSVLTGVGDSPNTCPTEPGALHPTATTLKMSNPSTNKPCFITVILVLSTVRILVHLVHHNTERIQHLLTFWCRPVKQSLRAAFTQGQQCSTLGSWGQQCGGALRPRIGHHAFLIRSVVGRLLDAALLLWYNPAPWSVM